MTVIVVGNHPVLGKGDKVFENIELAEEYEGGLIHYGFENVEIKPLGINKVRKLVLLGPVGTYSYSKLGKILRESLNRIRPK